MPQSLVQIYRHIVFSTKNRQAFLSDPVVRRNSHAYLAGVCRQLDAPALTVGGVVDHVHVLCRLAKTLTIADLFKELKRDSSKWIKQQDESLREFYWQAGYGAFSVSPAHVKQLTDYIDHQEEHHRETSFQDEFRRICRKYGVPLDERYAWD